MEITYYTIDDLRLQPGRPFQKGWTMEQFPTLREALARYRTFPACQTRSIGITDGVHVLELARCLPIYPEGVNGTDVQAAVPDLLPLWSEIPEAASAAAACVAALGLRYRISGNMVVPIPPREDLRQELRDKRLWLSGRSRTAIRRVYIVGAGWKQPDFLRQWSRTGHPLVPRFQVDGLTEQGAYLSMEVAPWEYDLLLLRTQKQETEKGEINDA